MAIRLDPFSATMWAHLLGRSLLQQGRFTEAIEVYSTTDYPRFGYHADMAGCYANLEKHVEDGEHVAEVLKLKPNFSVSEYIAQLAYKYERDRERHRTLLETAPLPA
ncbi:MAG: adenylate cyclase [Parasphingorhabdus sp.]|jgi:adenylate cyclase